MTGGEFLLRSEALKKAGFFKEELVFYAEDAELCYRVREHVYRILHLPTACMWHKVETTLAKNRAVQLQYSTRNSLYLIHRHHVGLYPVSLWVYLFGACLFKMAVFAILLRGQNAAGIWRGIQDWKQGRYGWISNS